MTKPLISVRHRVEPGDSIRLYPAAPAERFASLMASLYPKLASTVTVKRGYAAFSGAGEFIGIMTSTGLTSIRRNPLLIDGTQLFLRALLGGLHTDGHVTCSMYCDWDNYGTLRMMEKLGMGAKPSRSGHLSTAASAETTAYLAAAINRARDPYKDHRAYAERKLRSLPGQAVHSLIPKEAEFGTPTASLDVTLL